MIAVSVDPGKHHCGVALWSGTVLVSAQLVELARYGSNPNAAITSAIIDLTGAIPDLVIVEMPQVYALSKSKANPADLIALAGIAGAAASVGKDARLVSPAQWKRQVPKEIMITRIRARLTQAELDAVRLPKRASLAHNIFDAVGVGLWAAGRLRV